ncbi:gephyrin-like molybdotransferase Glp [Sulfurimonas sp. HSL-1716]|uniref:molybdopterin molybdotransferase MoeA n=1 Tax=Hydrocurvibacter sulfurireducens TaxID=3131937 RepID=UPI0031FA3ED6
MAVSVEEALKLIYDNVIPKTTKILPLESALNHVIAEDIIATHNLPPYDNSAMDGYAVNCDIQGKTVEVLHTIFAGDKDEFIINGDTVYKIMTGAKIPAGCEAIVPIEDVTVEGSCVTFSKNIKHGAHIRLAGEDIEIDDKIISKSTYLNAHHITLLASQGISHVNVYDKPRIALFASGSELKMHWQKLEEHQLYNTNTPTFLARAMELGCDAQFIGTAKDSLENIREMIQAALDFDLIITSGGVSVGDADFTKEAFSYFGFETIFEKVNIKPGKPTTFGRIGDTFILNLPGNPLAATLNFELFAKAAILAMSGNEAKYINAIETKMKDDYKLKPGKRTLLPGYFDGSDFTPNEKFAPGMVSPMSTANGFIMVDESISELQSGSSVKFIPTRFQFTSNQIKDLVTR